MIYKQSTFVLVKEHSRQINKRMSVERKKEWMNRSNRVLNEKKERKNSVARKKEEKDQLEEETNERTKERKKECCHVIYKIE